MESKLVPATVRVLYADTDKMGQAYYGSYMKWFEIGRSEWFRQHGKSYREMEKEGYFLPVIEAYCRYESPVFYDDEIKISTSLNFPTPARLKFDYKLYRKSDDGYVLVAEGYTVHVCVNSDRKPVKPPVFLKTIVEKQRKENG